MVPYPAGSSFISYVVDFSAAITWSASNNSFGSRGVALRSHVHSTAPDSEIRVREAAENIMTLI